MDWAAAIDLAVIVAGFAGFGGACLYVGYQQAAGDVREWKARAQTEADRAQTEANLRLEAEEYAATCESHAGWEAMRARGLQAQLERHGLFDTAVDGGGDGGGV